MLKYYADLGFPASVNLAWPLDTIKAAITTGPHASTLIPEANDFCLQELLERAHQVFSIILPVDVSLLVFGNRIRIYRLASVD